MKRYLLLAVLGFALVTAGLFFPWGDKQVVRADCTRSFDADRGDTVEICDMSSVDALYWSDHITADIRVWQTQDGTAGEVDATREFHDHALTDEKLDGNGALFWGRPLTWLGIGVAALGLIAVLATWRRDDVVRWSALWAFLGGGSIVLVGAVIALGGMVVHAGTWSGVSVSRLSPRIGAMMVGGGALLGTIGVLRFYQAESWRLQGILGRSPLAPIYELPDEPEQETNAPKVKQPLAWGRPFWAALVVAALFSVSLFLPLATKQVTVAECEPVAGGFVCEEQVHRAAYHSAYVDVTVTVDGERIGDGGRYGYSAFAAGHPGGAGLDWVGPLWNVPLVAGMTLAALQVRRLREGTVKVRRGAWILTAASVIAIVAALGLILWQTMQWPGSPAEPLRPSWGLIPVVLALLGFGAMAWRGHRLAKPARVVGVRRPTE